MNATLSLLATTDFSAHARHAAERAARIAHETQAALNLLHVIAAEPVLQLRAWLGGESDLEQRVRDEAEVQMQELARRLAGTHHVPVHTQVRQGPVLDTALNEADRVDARLIVVGARGAGFMRRLLLGTTAERLMRKTARPVLAVRQTPHERYRRVLVAMDFSPWSAGALALARWIAPRAHLVLATVFQVPYEDKLRLAGVAEATVERYRQQARDDAMRRLHEAAAVAGLAPSQWQPCVVEGDASFRLVEKELEFDCDLVVVGKHGTSTTVDFFLGSVTHHILAEGSSDVLISTVHSA